MRHRSLSIVATVACGVFALTACNAGTAEGGGGGGGGNVQINLAIPDPLESSVGATAEHFAQQVSKESGGAISVKVFPNGTLFGGNQEAAINQLGNGTLDATIISTSVYANSVPEMNAISLPYLFEDFDQYVEYIHGEPGQKLLDKLGEMNIEGLTIMTRTFREVTNSVRPITQPADMEGLRIRVPNNDLWVRLFEEVGADPTPMDFSEVYNALQLGVIDGQENPVEVPLANNFYEVQDYLSMTNHIVDGFVLGMNTDLFAGLSDEQQQTIRAVAKETADWKQQYDAKQEEEILAQLKSQGMEINELSDAGREEFRSIAQGIYPEFEDKIGAEFLEMTLEFVGRNEEA